MEYSWLGRRPYDELLQLMEERRVRVLEGAPGAEHLFLCEHSPVITCGRRTKPENLLLTPEALEARGVQLRRIERGGDVTYHGPGQLMIYPVVRVGLRVSDFMECVATVLAHYLETIGVRGARWEREEAGVWREGRKLAACGLHLRRGVSIHGFALNLSTPADAWSAIVPCGLVGRGPESVEALLGEAPSVESAAHSIGPALCDALDAFGAEATCSDSASP